ncbi:hypothetical protein BN2537_16535 [Streptomyces venezuelae]|nr:hypothetical protein BN2537_16535 [Streptomyces venezuelae]
MGLRNAPYPPRNLSRVPGRRADCTQFDPVTDKVRLPRAVAGQRGRGGRLPGFDRTR